MSAATLGRSAIHTLAELLESLGEIPPIAHSHATAPWNGE